MLLAGLAARADSSVKDRVKLPQGRIEAGCVHLPPKWKLQGLIAGAVGKEDRASVQTARVLAWQIDEDDRPLRVERVLLWLKTDKRWRLVNLYAHPDENGADRDWRVSVVYDVPYEGMISYAAAPTPDQLDHFLKASWWYFRPHDGFRMLGAEVCSDAWIQSFGKPPWHAYSKP